MALGTSDLKSPQESYSYVFPPYSEKSFRRQNWQWVYSSPQLYPGCFDLVSGIINSKNPPGNNKKWLLMLLKWTFFNERQKSKFDVVFFAFSNFCSNYALEKCICRGQKCDHISIFTTFSININNFRPYSKKSS